MLEYHPETYYVLLITLNFSLTLVVMLAACLCCKKKMPKNELLGLEGMVKLKNPDEVLVLDAVGRSESQADLNLSTVSNVDSEKRASTAAHRSLPDIPIAENAGDNCSELYETVADKRLLDSHQDRDKSPTPSLKQQASVSQHSSISQADDISSPYSRVKNSPHGYAKVRSAEHPYAQLNAPISAPTSALASSNSHSVLNNISNNHDTQLTNNASNQNLSEAEAEIPAASAIAGIIAASQDLPYMTPPISTQHFSGDSQDSSKGYTSISVREPLANILAQQSIKSEHCNPQASRNVNDSHYATVSDDSDETYAAIEDSNGRLVAGTNVVGATVATDIYTSGSETYAQIQPVSNNSIVVSVEINNTSSSFLGASASSSSNLAATKPNVLTCSSNTSRSTIELTPIPPPVDSLRAQMHSRQASSSSNNSSMGNLGSPKPEKRQANSPLPPTPKSTNGSQQHTHLSSSNNNLASGRNSVISVIECIGGVLDSNEGVAITGMNAAVPDDSPQCKIKSLSPSKDIEGMYAKVMKKNKFSRNASSSQNNSPVMARKYNEYDVNPIFFNQGVKSLDSATAVDFSELQNIPPLKMDKTRTRSNSYSVKDHGYETIPAEAVRTVTGTGVENRKSDCYANILQKERQMEEANRLCNSVTFRNLKPPRSKTENKHIFGDKKDYESLTNPHQLNIPTDPGYETLLKSNLNNFADENEKKSSDYDPNYEVLKHNHVTSAAALSDDGYAKVLEKHRFALDEDSIDGYSKVKGAELEDGATGGYSTIGEVLKNSAANHNYASILETKTTDTDSDHYARIAETNVKPVVPPSLPLALTAKAVHSVLDEKVDGKTSRLPELPATPSSLTSSSLIVSSSPASSSTITSTASTFSTHQTSSSQYESFTGSDTDPNYESVCYLSTNHSRDHPYERLQLDFSDPQQSASATSEECSGSNSFKAAANAQQASTSQNGASRAPSTSSTDPSENAVVDDYFQV